MKMTLAEIAKKVQGTLQGDPDFQVQGLAGLDDAAPTDLAFAGSAAYTRRIPDSSAGAILVPRDFEGLAGRNTIQVDDPRQAFMDLVNVFHPPGEPAKGIHPAAVIGGECVFGHDVSIGACTTVAERVALGEGTIVYPNVCIGSGVTIGAHCRLYPNVTIMAGCILGDRVVVHPGSVIGSDGYGFEPEGTAYRKIRHVGIVQIDDDVEIGAGNTIDRATFGRTWIQRGVKTDNLVHIAHNVTVGEDTLLVAQVGIAGSVTIGRHAILAGQAGISGHLTIGDNVTIGPQSGVGKPIEDGRTVIGSPAMPHRHFLRMQRTMPYLPEMHKTLRQLEKRLQALEAREHTAPDADSTAADHSEK